MARERDERSAGLLGIVSAIGASYVTFAARTRSMRRYGQRPTGVVEDALIVGLAAWIASRARRS
jgi:hypothetical protein